MFVVFFFKQKTAYEMRISDWSSDVCSSDLQRRYPIPISCKPSCRTGCSRLSLCRWPIPARVATAAGASRRLFGTKTPAASTPNRPSAQAPAPCPRRDRAQPVGDHAEQRIADRMAERIVDCLEAIEIDEQQRRDAAGCAAGQRSEEHTSELQ